VKKKEFIEIQFLNLKTLPVIINFERKNTKDFQCVMSFEFTDVL